MTDADMEMREDLYEEAFARMKKAAGVSDIDEVVRRFETQEETTNHLLELQVIFLIYEIHTETKTSIFSPKNFDESLPFFNFKFPVKIQKNICRKKVSANFG